MKAVLRFAALVVFRDAIKDALSQRKRSLKGVGMWPASCVIGEMKFGYLNYSNFFGFVLPVIIRT